jgi:hypothetical protein
MGCTKREALKLPDQLLVRYFRGGEIERIAKVTTRRDRVTVRVSPTVTKTHQADEPTRTDEWRDLGGGLGYVPETG